MAFFLEGYSDWGLLALRIAIGAVFIYHGMPKLRQNMARKMAKGIGISPGLLMLIGLGEILAGLAILIGYYTQFAAAYLSAVMLGALHFKISKWNVPFSSQKGSGWEFDLVLLASALVLLLIGAGAISVDSAMGLWP